MTVTGGVLIAVILGPVAWLILRSGRATRPRLSSRRNLRTGTERASAAPVTTKSRPF
jgi:hypothetical protein